MLSENVMVMKNLYIAMFLAMAASVATAQEKTDTLMSVKSASRVVLTENPQGFRVEVTPDSLSGDSTVVFAAEFSTPVTTVSRRWQASTAAPIMSSSFGEKWDLCVGGPGIGWVNACGQPAGLGVEMGKSIEVSWLNILALKYRLPWKTSTISVGFGVDWRNYRISTSSSRFVTENGRVTYGPYPEGADGKGSRLQVFGMGIPVLWQQSLPFKMFGSRCMLGVGAVFNYNSSASLKTKWYTEEGLKAEQTSHNIGHRRFTVDLMALVRVWGAVNVYVRYSPNSVLRGAGQLQFRPLSSGIILYY